MQHRLKRETGLAHRRVEEAFDIASATECSKTYVLALSKLYNAYVSIWRALLNSDGNAARVAEREAQARVARLESDLLAFGIRAGVSSNSRPIALLGANETLGCEYVMRGSALGGLVILKQAEGRLNVSPQRGGQFFFGDGHATANAWLQFRQRLAGLDPQGADADEVVVGAIKTFAHIEAALSDTYTRDARPE